MNAFNIDLKKCVLVFGGHFWIQAYVIYKCCEIDLLINLSTPGYFWSQVVDSSGLD